MDCKSNKKYFYNPYPYVSWSDGGVLLLLWILCRKCRRGRFCCAASNVLLGPGGPQTSCRNSDIEKVSNLNGGPRDCWIPKCDQTLLRTCYTRKFSFLAAHWKKNWSLINSILTKWLNYNLFFHPVIVDLPTPDLIANTWPISPSFRHIISIHFLLVDIL